MHVEGDSTASQTVSPPYRVTYHEIASKLLSDKLYLTALELHAELLESGREIKYLKDYFSNPGNFECQYDRTEKIIRSGSQLTLDSLDLTRYSEDADTDNIAVLEFELRKARETITALRNNLTEVTEPEFQAVEKTSAGNSEVAGSCAQSETVIKPHERRALNFLINEYLMIQGYKLTSITFADENADQDFEDWDDVGLNIAKPAELLTVYRNGLRKIRQQNAKTISTQTDEVLENVNSVLKIQSLEVELHDMRSQNVQLQRQLTEIVHADSTMICTTESSSSKNSFIGVESLEKFEMVCDQSAPSQPKDSISMDYTVEVNEWTNLTLENDVKEAPTSFNSQFRNRSSSYVDELLAMCPIKSRDSQIDAQEQYTMDNLLNILTESLMKIIPNLVSSKRDDVMDLLTAAVCLQSHAEFRDKLLQLVFSIKKKPTQAERDIILRSIVLIAQNTSAMFVENELLPQCWEQISDKCQERRILAADACRYLIPYISIPIRNSLLLSIIQQMLEDRCVAVRESAIRSLALVIALCADPVKYAQCEDIVLNSIRDVSNEVGSLIVKVLVPVLAFWSLDLKQFASSLMTRLLQQLTQHLKNLSVNESTNSITGDELSLRIVAKVLELLSELLPFILIYIATIEVDEKTKPSSISHLSFELSKVQPLCNPLLLGADRIGQLNQFQAVLSESPTYTSIELDWFLDTIIPDLINNLNYIEIIHCDFYRQMLSFFKHMSVMFGNILVEAKIKPLFESRIVALEQILVSGSHFHTCINVLPIYLVGILCPVSPEEINDIFKRFLFALPICGIPIDTLEYTVVELCQYSATMTERILDVLWEGVVHSRPLVRIATSSLLSAPIQYCAPDLLTARLVPALVTLANDTDVMVRTAVIPALGRLIGSASASSVHDKAYMQLQLYLSDGALAGNHSLQRQLIVTMGDISAVCKPAFRNYVILPQLSASCTALAQADSVRKIDMAMALIEAYANLIYNSLHGSHIAKFILPGLKNLEQIVAANEMLHPHKDVVDAMLREMETRTDLNTSPHQARLNSITGAQHSTLSMTGGSLHMNPGIEEVRHKMSKIFNTSSDSISKSKTFSNLQGLFKKK